jgi:hypothetical protein
MGINRWSDIEERKRVETGAKADNAPPQEEKGDSSSRVRASDAPDENPEKRRVLEKLEEWEGDR